MTRRPAASRSRLAAERDRARRIWLGSKGSARRKWRRTLDRLTAECIRCGA